MSEDPKAPTRRELYDLVWSKPMMHAAVAFGISGTGLMKICQRYAIPTPPRGHWAKLQHGKKISKEPFVKWDDPSKDRVVIHGGDLKLPPEARAIIRTAKAMNGPRSPAGTAPLTPAQQPSEPPEIHPVVLRTAQALRNGKPDKDGVQHATGNGTFGVIVGVASVERAISVLNGLAHALAARGLNPEATGRSIHVQRGPDEVMLTLTERVRHEKHIPTPAETAAEALRRKRAERYWSDRSRFGYAKEPSDLYTSAVPQIDTIHTGELVLQSDGYEGKIRRSWGDGRIQRLERMSAEIAVGVDALLTVRKANREESEERSRRWADQARRAQLVKQRAEREAQRLVFLNKLVETQREIEALTVWLDGSRTPGVAGENDSYQRLHRWAQSRLAALREKMHADAVSTAIDEANLFPEPDALDDPS